MAQDANPPPGGGTNSRPLDGTVAETGPGIPDEAVGPGQRSVADQNALAEDEAADAIARKLQAEADRRWRTGN